ncbi:MAG: tRNA (adenosine(37)-N6)-dimethylallyltransferase MiaA [Methylobacterium mesophilicum]|nr:tRNA (adenosine(37)-N6)-dimethylallyltransferase MiaA [Methylobacterium mesophilicum]
MNHQGAEKRAILIAGPTASGKSALALDLAGRICGTVINADSMQVYADLHILTARPSSAETARVPHRLFGHVDAAAAYSVGRWLDDVRLALEETWTAGRRPVVVGGTGLYFKALTQGLSAIPAVPDALRARIRQEAEGQAPEQLHARLAQHDPVMAARLRPSDPQRILRALEVWEATGRSLAAFQGERQPPLLPVGEVAASILEPDRDDLKRRIERRFDAMMAAGALDEVARLAARNLDPTLPAMRALGVPPLLAHLRGEIDLDTAVRAGKGLTWQYARRQMTFIRSQLADRFASGSSGDAGSSPRDPGRL